MREGFARDDEKVEEKRRRRASKEIIDVDEAPQVVIQEEDRLHIEESEAKAYVAKQEGVKIDTARDEGKTTAPKKNENVSLGLKKSKNVKEGLKRPGEELETKGSAFGKSRKPARKEKKLKLSFEEDE